MARRAKRFDRNIKNNDEINKNDDYVEVEGKVTDILPGHMFRVLLDNGCTVLAHVSGKIRMNNIKILTGDTVVMELSTYDLTRGRIIYNKK